MSSGKRNRVGRNVVKPLVVAVALALPGAACFATSMTDVVTTRSDQNIYEQYGRDSVYAFSRDAKPLRPEQTGSHQLGNFFDKSKAFVAGAWHKTESLFTRHGSGATSTVQYEPQRYGRAGGYAGSDRVAMLGSTTATMASASSDVVKTGEESGNAADESRMQRSSAVNSDNPSANTYDGSSASANSSNQGAAMNADQDQPTAAVVEEQTIIERRVIVEPSPAPSAPDTSAATPSEQTPLAPPDQSTANSDVLRSSPDLATDNGRADSAAGVSDQDSMRAQTR